MQPRGRAETFATVFAITAIPFGMLWSLFTGSPMDESILLGGFFGLGMGAFGASRLQGTTITIPFQDKRQFIGRLNVHMAQISYFPETQAEHYLTYLPSASHNLSIGPISLVPTQYFRIFVQLDANEATLIGPKYHLDRLMRIV